MTRSTMKKILSKYPPRAREETEKLGDEDEILDERDELLRALHEITATSIDFAGAERMRQIAEEAIAKVVSRAFATIGCSDLMS